MLSEGKAIGRLEREVAMLLAALIRARPFVFRAADDAHPTAEDARRALKMVDEALRVVRSNPT